MVSTTWLASAAMIDKRKSMIVFKGHRTANMKAHYFLCDTRTYNKRRRQRDELDESRARSHSCAAHMHKHAKHKLAL